MRTVYKVKQRTIHLNNTKERIKLWCFGDIHRFTKSCDEDRWKWFLTKAKESHDENTFYLGLGDYLEFASAKEQKALIQTAGLHEQTIEDFGEMVSKRNRALAMEMSFMKPNILGLIDGNHNWIYSNGKTGTEDLAERLNTEYLGWLCHYTLNVHIGKSQKVSNVYIVACHGRAGGRTAGATVNQVAELRNIFPVADIYCVSEDTEILTINGWKKHFEINIGDDIFSFNSKTNTIVYDKIEDKINYNYSGDMVHIKNINTDQLLIPEHRVYYKHDGDWLINKAEHLYNINAQIKLPLAGLIDYYDCKLSDDFVSLAGWIISEGHFKGKGSDYGSGILIYQKYENKVNIIRQLLTKLQLSFTERINTEGLTVFYIRKEDSLKIREFVNNKNRLPNWIYTLSQHQFDLFWESFVMGDGHISSKSNGTAYSSEKSLMDDLQIALTLHNYRSSLKYKNGGFKDGGWVLYYCKRNTTELNTKLRVKKVNYNGLVWCVSTRENTFIARRSGKVFITGNCEGHDHQRWALPHSVLVPTFTYGEGVVELKQKRQFYCRSGSFKKGYSENESGYEIGRLLKPADLGALLLDIGFHYDLKGDRLITDIQAII